MADESYGESALLNGKAVRSVTLWNILIPTLAFVAVVCIGGAAIRLRTLRRRPILERLHNPTTHAAPTSGESAEHQDGFQRALHTVGQTIAPKGPSRALRDRMIRAGFYSRSAPLIFLGSEMMSLGVAMLVSALIVAPLPIAVVMKVLMVLIAAMAGMMIPNLIVGMRAANRQAEVQRHLPDAVDLLEICVSAGMGVDMAWNAVTDQIRRVSPILADEMSLTDMEIHLGAGRATAVRHMAQRTGADELTSLVAAFVQAERFGTSMSETLRGFASSVREGRTQRAEEAGEKMAVRILFPMIIFIFPTILIVTAGPAAIKIAEAFGGK